MMRKLRYVAKRKGWRHTCGDDGRLLVATLREPSACEAGTNDGQPNSIGRRHRHRGLQKADRSRSEKAFRLETRWRGVISPGQAQGIIKLFGLESH